MAHEIGRRDSNRLGSGNGNGTGNGNGNNNGPYGPGSGWTSSGGEQVRDIMHVVFKRKRLIAVLFIVVALPGLFATLMQKPSFLASAKVMISTQRSDPTVQPTDLTRLENIQLNESLVNSEVHVISSRDLLEQVVRVLSGVNDGAGPRKDTNFGEQVLSLAGKLSITPIKASNVIQIDYKSPDPMIAARVINRVVDEYLAYHATVHGAKGLSRFYDEQRRGLEQQLRRAEDALVNFPVVEGIASPKDEVAATVRTVSEINAMLRDVTTNISGLEERIRALRDQVALQPEVVKRSQYLEVNPVITQLSTQLVDRKVDRVTLLRKYTEEDRHVKDNGEEIAELEQQIQEAVRERPTVVAHQMYRTNPIREDRLRELLEREGSVREMRARQATLDEELSHSNRRLILLKQKSLEYDRLENDVKVRRDTYDLYVKRQQEAKISQAMDEQKLVNVDVVQRPALPLPRADTQRISVLLSIIAGLVVGLAGAFGWEFLNRSLRTEQDVSRHLGLPLLGSIGEMPRA